MSFLPLNILKRALNEAKAARDEILANSFPVLPIDEVIKIDYVISQLEAAMQDIKKVPRANISAQDLVELYRKYMNNIPVTELCKIYDLHRSSVWRYVKIYKKLESKYLENG